jgi:hypothetical protein
MLVATRDPMHSPGTHDGAQHPRPTASHATRFVAAMQIFGSVMAIPVGLGTAYSLYRANFSVDTTCQALRANIISMIDKKIDATARRMLVRHDVETFERTCGGVDPDAEAAFKSLLAAEPPVRHVEAPVRADAAKRVEPPKAEARAEPKEVHKPDLRAAVPAEPVRDRNEAVREPARDMPKETAKEPVKEPVRETKETAKDTIKETIRAAEAPAQQADARWLDAVRGALVAHEKPVAAGAAADATVSRGAPPHPLALPPPPIAAAPLATAPALPPPTQVAEPVRATAAASADPDRPVPPASIPDETGPKPTGWISHVPFVGQVLAK